MKRLMFFLFLLITLIGFGQNNYESEFIKLNGKKIVYKSNGLNTRKVGQPVIVFQSGAGLQKENWDTLFLFLPKTDEWGST